MCVSVISAAGNLTRNQAAFQPLVNFIKNRKGGVILVISPLDEIYSLVISGLDSLSHGATEAPDFNSLFSDIWRNTTGTSPNAKFHAFANRLSGLLRGISLTGDCSDSLKENILSFCGHLSALIFSEKLRISGVGNFIRIPEELRPVVSQRNEIFGSPENATATAVCPKSGETWITADLFRTSGMGKIHGWIASVVHTAALFAVKYQATELILWSGEIRFLSAPPDLVFRSCEIARLTFQEAGSLSCFMDDTIHPDTLDVLAEWEIPVHVYKPEVSGLKPVTIIGSGTDNKESTVCAVACTDDISLLEVTGPGVGSDPGILAGITNMLSGLAISTNSLRVSRNSIGIVMDLNSGRLAESSARETQSLAPHVITLHRNVSLLALIGQNGNTETAAVFFQALAAAKVKTLVSGTGEPALAGFAVVRTSDAGVGVNAVFRAFFKIRNYQKTSYLTIVNQN